MEDLVVQILSAAVVCLLTWLWSRLRRRLLGGPDWPTYEGGGGI